MKLREVSWALCVMRIPIGLKRTFYKTLAGPAVLYGAKCWAVDGKIEEQTMRIARMRMRMDRRVESL